LKSNGVTCATPPEVVCQRVEEEFGATLGPEALTDFVKTLDHNRLLETAEEKAKRRDRVLALGGEVRGPSSVPRR